MGCGCNREPKPKCTPRVLEIEKPEEKVLFHKVVLPASAGDDITNPPTPGKYENVLLEYEANGHLYLYSSDGIPTQIPAVNNDFNELEQYAHLFDTVADMKAANGLASGVKCQTLGKYTIDDGLGAYYLIDETGEILLDNGLYASVIPDFGGNNYYDINYTVSRVNHTTYYKTYIPKRDDHNNLINFTVNLTNNYPSAYARENNTSATFNGVAYCNAAHQYGSVIHDGQIVANVDMSDVPDCYYYIGIDENRNFQEYKANEYTAQNLVDAGCKEAWLAYWRLVTNGTQQDFNTIQSQLYDENVVNKLNPRQSIGIKADGTIVIITCDGRSTLDKGMTSSQLAALFIEEGCNYAWNMDGGGSCCTVIKGNRINKLHDDIGMSERSHRFTLNVKRTTIDKELGAVNSISGTNVNELENKLLPMINQSIIRQQNGRGFDGLLDEGQSLLLATGVTNPILPGITAYYTMTIPHPNPQHENKYGFQIAQARDYNRLFTRIKTNGEYSKWQNVFGNLFWADNTSVDYTLTDTATYEKLPFIVSSIFTNNGGTIHPVSTTEGEPSLFYEFTIDCDDDNYFEISFSAQCHATNESGERFLRVEIDDAEYATTMMSMDIEPNKNVCFSTSGIIKTSLKNKKIALKAFGYQGDVWNKPKITLRQIV